MTRPPFVKREPYQLDWAGLLPARRRNVQNQT